MVGSVYVYAMDAQPARRAARTRSSGAVVSPGIRPGCIRGAWAMVQFWQNRQWKLQPAVAMEKARLTRQTPGEDLQVRQA